MLCMFTHRFHLVFHALQTAGVTVSVSAGHQVLVSRDARLAPETAGHRVLRLAPACDVSLHAHVTMSLETETKTKNQRTIACAVHNP